MEQILFCCVLAGTFTLYPGAHYLLGNRKYYSKKYGRKRLMLNLIAIGTVLTILYIGLENLILTEFLLASGIGIGCSVFGAVILGGRFFEDLADEKRVDKEFAAEKRAIKKERRVVFGGDH